MLKAVDKYGLHIETQGLEVDKGLGKQIVDMIIRLDLAGHRLASAVVIDHLSIMNAIADHVDFPVFRSYPNGQKFNPSALQSTMTAQQHANYIYDQHYPVVSQLNPRCYVQFRNENNVYQWDSDFDLQLMLRTHQEGKFKAAIGGYNTGTPEVINWQAYKPALRACKQYGYAVVIHEYGYEENQHETSLPVSDPKGYQYFGGRDQVLYASVPLDCQPDLIVGECGASDGYTHPDTIHDMWQFNQQKLGLLWFKGFCFWGFGSSIYNANGLLAAFEHLVMNGL